MNGILGHLCAHIGRGNLLRMVRWMTLPSRYRRAVSLISDQLTSYRTLHIPGITNLPHPHTSHPRYYQLTPYKRLHTPCIFLRTQCEQSNWQWNTGDLVTAGSKDCCRHRVMSYIPSSSLGSQKWSPAHLKYHTKYHTYPNIIVI